MSPQPRDYYENLARSYATEAGIDPNIFVAQINQESGFDPTAGPSSGGAMGIAQIIPQWHPGVDPWDPDASLQYAANLMAGQLQNYGGDIRKALTAYHAGPGNLNEAIKLGGADWETFLPTAAGDVIGRANQVYLSNILGGGPLTPLIPSTQLPPTRSPFRQGTRASVRRLQEISLAVFGRPSDELPSEPFPGFGDLVRPYTLAFDRNAVRLSELSEEINATMQGAPSPTSGTPFAGGIISGMVDLFTQGMRAGLPFAPGGNGDKADEGREEFNKEIEALRVEYDSLMGEQADISWLFAVTGAQTTAYSGEDFDVRLAAQALVDQYVSEGTPTQRQMLQPVLDALQDYMEEPVEQLSTMSSEELAALSQQEIEEKLYTIPHARPVASYMLTTDQLRTSLKGFRAAGPDELTTGEQLRQLLVAQGLDSEEAQAYRMDVEARVKDILDEARENDRKIEAMRAGEGDWMLPKPGVADYLKAMATRPIFVASQALDKYFRGVVHPATGAVVTGVAVLTPGEQQIERNMELYADEGNFWSAAGEAWRAQDWHPAAKFAVETIADPTSYIGWGIAPKLLKPIPLVGRRLSTMVAAAEHGYVQLANVPFRVAGKAISTIPKPITTLANLERGRATGLAVELVGGATKGTRFNRVTAAQTTEALGMALEREARFPAILADKGVQLGKLLRAMPVPDVDNIVAWAQRSGGNITREHFARSQTLLHDLDVLLVEAANDPNRVGIMARQIMSLVGIEDDAAGKGFLAAKRLVDEYVEAGSRQAQRLIQGDSMNSILDNIGEHSYQLTIKNRQSQAALQAERMGMVTSHLNKLAEGTGAIWSGTIEKWMIRPLARGYLLFGMYHLWNVAETRGKLIAAGVNPFRKGGNPQMYLDTWADSIGPRPEILMERGRTLIRGETVETTLQVSKGMDKLMAPTAIRRFLRESTAARIQANDQALFIHRKAIAALKREQPEQWSQIQSILDEAGMDFKFLPKDLRPWAQEATVASIISGPDVVRRMPGEVTAERLRGFRIANLLSKFDLIDDVTQEYVTSQARNGRLFTNTDDVINEVTDLVWEKHLRSPEFFAANFEDMVDEMAGASITSWEDLNKRIRVLQGMSRGYGDVLEHQYAVAREASEKTIHAGGHDRIWGLWREGSDEFGSRAAAAFDNYLTMARSHISAAGERATDVDLLMARYQALKDLDAAAWGQRRQVQEVLFTQEAPAGSSLRSSNEWWKGAMDRLGAPFRARTEERKLLMREIYGLEARIGGQPRFPVPDTAGRNLGRADMAVLYGIRPDDVSAMTFLTDLQAIQGRDAFIEDALSRAVFSLDPGADLRALGWTEERIGAVWDDIMREFRLDPKNVSVVAPTMMQIDAIKKEVMDARLASELTPEARGAFEEWSGDVSDRLGRVAGYADEGATTSSWLEAKGRSVQNATEEFYQTFPDYIDLNHMDTFMRSQFPFWTYEFHRLFYLPRQFMRTPGLATGLGRYNEATQGDNYMHIPGTSLEVNPLRGTILMGGLRRLLIRDYPEFYDTFPGAQQALDISGRFGFYPGAHVSLANILFGTKTPQFGQVGEMVPVWMKAPVQGFQTFANLTGNETLQAASKRLANVFIPERYRDYMISMKVSEIGQIDEETGQLIAGDNLLTKRLAGTPLSESEQDLWDRATGEMSFTFIVMDQTAMLRFRPEEMDQAREEMNTIVSEYTGLSKDQLDYMRDWGFRWQDIFPPSPEMRELLNATEALQRWSGFTQVLFGASHQNFRARRGEFWDEVDGVRLDIKAEREKLDCGFGFPGTTGCDHPGSLSIRDYLDQDSALSQTFHERFEALRGQDRYTDVPVTREEIVEYYQNNNIQLPIEHPMTELVRMYHDIELVEKLDPETGRLELDFATFYAQREMLLQAAGDRRDELEEQILKYETGLGKLHRWSYDNYMRPYYARRDLTISRYSPQAQLIINRWLATDVPLIKQQLQDIELDGTRVISQYQKDMRTSSKRLRFYNPGVDAWLAFWGVTSTFMTDQGQSIYEELMRRYRPGVSVSLMPVESGVELEA